MQTFQPNTFDMTIDINYSSSQTQGTGTNIINDVNLATLKCDSNTLSTAQECKYTWNIDLVQDGNYYILTEISDGSNTDFNAGTGDFNIWDSTPKYSPDANVLYPVSEQSFDKASVSTIDINISIQDPDTNTFDMTIDINYSSSQTQGTGTNIINDVNLATLKCDSNNLTTPQQCKYTWIITGVSNGTYYILTEINDGGRTDFNAGTGTFTITNSNNEPDINIISPANNATSSNYFMPLDVNIGDAEGDDMNIFIFGSTSQLDLNTSLLYYLKTSDNNVEIDYNWNAPVVQPDVNTMALYHFDKRAAYDETATSVRDFSGNSNTATCPSAGNCPDFNAVGGKFASAFYFDGGSPTASNDYFEIADSDDFDMIDWTIMGWFNMTGTGDTVNSGTGGVTVYPLVTKGKGEAEAANRDIAFFTGIQETTNYVCADMEYDNNSGNDPVCGSTAIQTNKMYHFAAVFKSSDTPEGTFKIYLNGIQDGLKTIAGKGTQSSAQKVGIGTAFRQDTGASDGGFKGYIDEIAIINKALTADEIANYYQLDYDTYYWDVNANDADNNSTSGIYQFILKTGKIPDANVVYPVKGESFDIVSVSTIDINVSLQDDDTNTFDMTLSLRYSTTQTEGSGTAIITDVNVATLKCDSNNLTTPQQCKYTWDISSVATGTYYILATASDGTNTDFNAGGNFVITSSAATPDANVLYPMNGETFDKGDISTIDINISIQDLDTTTFDLNIDINYSTEKTQGTGTAIINDVNLATLKCDSNTLSTAQECKYSWNISAMEAGNYYILTTVNDKYASDFNAGANDFNIWCVGSWPYSLRLTFDNSFQTEDLNNFPVMVRLNSDIIDYSNVGKSNGGDLRFFDHDENVLMYEIEDWNTNADSIIWVRIPNIPSGSTTDYITMKYGNECVPDGNQNAAVWANGYNAVYHFAETSGYYLDSTENNNDANTASIQVTSRTNKDVNGLGYYPEFGGIPSADHIIVPNSTSLNAAAADFTIMCRTNAPTDATLADTDFMRKGSTNTAPPTNTWWKLEWGDAITTNSLHLNIHDGSGDDHTNYTKAPDGLWHDVWGTRDVTNTLGVLWLDGISVATDASTRITDLANSANMGIGSKDTGDDDHFDGFLDECRVESVLRSSSWIRAQHYSMDGNFISFSYLPDANIWQIDGYDLNATMPSFSYSTDGNLSVKFWASDADNHDLNFNMWYDTSANGKTNKIIGDINLSTDTEHGNCDTNSKITGMVCSWDWNIFAITNNNYWVTIEINDGIDSNTATTQKSFMVDNVGPTTINNADGNNTWQNTDANIQFSCTDGAGSGCKNFYYSVNDANAQLSWNKEDVNIGIVLNTDGNHSIWYWSDDTTDNNENAHLVYLAIDKDPPTTIDNVDGNNVWQKVDANIQFSCTDEEGSGCKNFYYSIDDTNYQTGWGTDLNRGITLTTDGNHEIFYWSDDTTDNNENAHLVYLAIDKDPPTTIDNVDGNNVWQKVDANIQFSCTDTLSGCKNMYYSLDDVNYQKGWGADLNRGISLTTDGNHEIWYWSDNTSDNNETSKLVYLAIDKTAPTITISSPTTGSSQTSTTVSLVYTGTDATSGIAAYYIKADSGSWISNSANTSYTFSSQSAGSHTYCAKAEDNASNSAEICTNTTLSLGVPWGIMGVGPQARAIETKQLLGLVNWFVLLADPGIPILDQTEKQIELQQKRFATANELTIKRNIKSFALMTTRGITGYKNAIIIEVENIGIKALKGVEILEAIPKEMVENAALVESGSDFSIMEADPTILRFFLGDIQPGKMKSVEYSFERSFEKGEMTAEMFNAMQAPTVLVQLQSEDKCMGVLCNDFDTCTRDYCVEGKCTYAAMKEEAKCGTGKVCRQGKCVPIKPVEGVIAIATKADTIAIILLVGAITLGLTAQITTRKWKRKRGKTV